MKSNTRDRKQRNQTRVAQMGGEHFSTAPPMLPYLFSFLVLMFQYFLHGQTNFMTSIKGKTHLSVKGILVNLLHTSLKKTEDKANNSITQDLKKCIEVRILVVSQNCR